MAATRIAVWSGITLSAAWVSLYLAWQILSAINFAFPALYDLAGIGDNVREFAPQNRYKKDFGLTTRAEHYRLFGEIVRAINRGGEGLEQLRYHGPDGREIDTLLRHAEVVHLQDVARLLDRLRVASYVALAALALLVALCCWCEWGFPRVGRVLLAATVVCGAGVAVTMLYGAEQLFYRWHTLVFPPEHQWFFYYQESLMTTLMRAPVIFGYIAALLGVMALAIFAAILASLRRFVPRAAAGVA